MPNLYSPRFRKATSRHAKFARQITLAEFGHRYGRAIDQGDFVDRLPARQVLRLQGIGG